MSSPTGIRQPAVAGLFYPGKREALAAEVRQMLANARRFESVAETPKVLIAPHAGYAYSGPIAANAYALLAKRAGRIRRVVLLGPAHRVWFHGLALPEASAFATPLGPIPVDEEAVAALRALPQVIASEQAHAQEHSLEVHLPFLQTVLGEFRLVPIAVGDATSDEVAEVLDLLWGGDETLIVISSDLSHYLPYRSACAVDSETAAAILDLREPIDHDRACGGTPINGLLRTARRRGLTPKLLDLRNSGDTSGDRSRVVGYAAFAFFPPSDGGAGAREDSRPT